MRKLFLLSVVFALSLTSCRKMFGKRIKGSGTVKTENRNITGFTTVDVSSSIDVYIKQDSVQQVSIETDDNLLQYIETREEGGTLYIDMKRNYNLKPSHSIKVYVSGSGFRKFSASGACDIYTQGLITNTESIAVDLSGSSDAELELNAPRVKVDVTGSGSVKLKGQTKDLELDGTGSTSLKCADMMSENVNVDITGSGSAEVFASVKLEVDVAGSGSVKYKGSPSINQHITGSGSIRKME